MSDEPRPHTPLAEISNLQAIALFTASGLGLMLAGAIALYDAHPAGYRSGWVVGLSTLGLLTAEVVRRGLVSPRWLADGYFVAVGGVTAAVYVVGPELSVTVAAMYMWFGSTVIHLPRARYRALLATVGVGLWRGARAAARSRAALRSLAGHLSRNAGIRSHGPPHGLAFVESQ